MSTKSDVRDILNPEVAQEDGFNAAAAALDAYIEAAPCGKMTVWDFLQDAYLGLLTATRAKELEWFGVLVDRFGGVCEKRREYVDGRIMRKALTVAQKLRKFLFCRHSRVAFRFYSRALLNARRVEIADSLTKIHDCGGVVRALTETNEKFDALMDALKDRCYVGDVHVADYTKQTTKKG